MTFCQVSSLPVVPCGLARFTADLPARFTPRVASLSALVNMLARRDRDLSAVRDVLPGEEQPLLADLEAWLERHR